MGGVGNCCGRPKCLGSRMGRKLNAIWRKPRITSLIMKRKNLLMCVKMKIYATNVCLSAFFVGVSYCHEEKSKKMS